MKQLETFCKAAETGSFSRAGEAIYLTQPTVSGHIASLEQTVGLRLFDRLGRRVALTAGGQLFYRYAKEILRLRDEAINAIYEFSHLIKGRITIGGSTIPGEYFLPKVMGRFQREAPGISISLVIADSQEIIDKLRAGEIEVGVVGMRFDGKGVDAHPLFHDRVIIIASSQHPLVSRREISWEELRTAPLLIRERGSGTRKAFEGYVTAAGLRLDDFSIVGEVGSSTAVKEGVKGGIGLGIISDLAVQEEIEGGSIKEIIVQGQGALERDFFVVVPTGRDLSPPARRFLEFLQTQRC
ncbi:MAG: selenium metabolism-associated LysR family transcriptional regulator [Desulfobacterales bacterium]|nr:selenium metabolism-associated LysR family transcriptional regulator [Desulfobacterales bacterium]